MNKNQFLSAIKIVVVAMILAVGIRYASADWAPTSNIPPSCPSGDPGCDAPLNVGYGFQTKGGGLWLIGKVSATGAPLNYGLVVEQAPIHAMGGLVIEVRDSDPVNLVDGRMWMVI